MMTILNQYSQKIPLRSQTVAKAQFNLLETSVKSDIKAENLSKAEAYSSHFKDTLYSQEAKTVMAHPIWTPEDLSNVEITHLKPKNIRDKLAFYSVSSIRFGFDVLSGYAFGNLNERIWLNRITFLETVAGVPGMIGAMIRHLDSLRKMEPDYGWIHTLLQEAENERMHLMTALIYKKPSFMFRLLVILTQGTFLTSYTLAYIIDPKFCHRFVGYLEEEAVKTYTHLLDELKKGKLQSFQNSQAPFLARDYWKIPENSTFIDIIEAIRADEAHHRLVNHTFADVPHNTPNPF